MSGTIFLSNMKLANDLREFADTHGGDAIFHLEKAVEQYLYDSWKQKAVQQGTDEIERGEYLTDDAVQASIEKWSINLGD